MQPRHISARAHHILAMLRNHHARGPDLIHARVGRIQRPRDVVEPDLALYNPAQFLLEASRQSFAQPRQSLAQNLCRRCRTKPAASLRPPAHTPRHAPPPRPAQAAAAAESDPTIPTARVRRSSRRTRPQAPAPGSPRPDTSSRRRAYSARISATQSCEPLKASAAAS